MVWGLVDCRLGWKRRREAGSSGGSAACGEVHPVPVCCGGLSRSATELISRVVRMHRLYKLPKVFGKQGVEIRETLLMKMYAAYYRLRL